MLYGTQNQMLMWFRSNRLTTVLWGCWLLWASVLGPSVASAADQMEIEYAKGVVAYGEGNYLEALSHLRRAVDFEPRHPEARFYLGLTFFRLGEFQYAINTLKWVLHLDPSARYVHHHLGAAYLQLRRFEEALAEFQLAEQHEATNSDTQFYLGYTYYQLKQYRQAPSYFQRALELDPSLAGTAHYYQGLAFYAAERDRQARVSFERAVHTDPAAPLAGQAQRYLQAIERRKHAPRLLRIQGNIGFEYDDNVVLEPNDDVLEFGEQRDGRIVLSLAAKLMPGRQRDWQWGATYDLFQSMHFSNTFAI